MDFDFPSTDAATLPRDSNDVLLIQRNHADWQPVIGFVTPRSHCVRFIVKHEGQRHTLWTARI